MSTMVREIARRIVADTSTGTRLKKFRSKDTRMEEELANI